MTARQLACATALEGGRLGVALVAGAMLLACGSEDSHPGGVVDTPGLEAGTTKDATTRVDVFRSDAATQGDARADGDASSDGAAELSDEADAPEPPFCTGDGGPVHPEQPTAPAQAPGVCQKTLHRAMTTSVTQGATIRFVGLTPDARTIAWFESDTLNYADRADASSAWGAGHSVDGLTPGPDRPALSPDGLRIVVVKKDRHGFAEYTRLDRQNSRFGSDPSETQFSAINAVGVMLGANEWLGSPVLSSDDRTFVYLRGEANERRHDAVYASSRPGNVGWPMGAALHATELDALCGLYRRPTGLSSDALTLFYWDEVLGGERATFRKAVDAVFAGSIDLGDAVDGVPNEACNTVYFTSPTGGVSSASLVP
jgi:hypothetical protein